MKRIIFFLKRIDWVNTAFLTLTPTVGIVGTLIIWKAGALEIRTVILAGVMMVITGLSVTAGYHRLFAHKSYEAGPLARFFFLMFGAASFENSALTWASDHRDHHLYVDTDKDPYSIKRGFLFAHMGWIFLMPRRVKKFENAPDLLRDPLVRFQHRYFIMLCTAFGFMLPMGIAAMWGDGLGGFVIAGALRIVINQHFTFSINSFAHYFGKQPYSDKNTSRDSWWLALFTYGEGYHNFHHLFSCDYRNGIRSFHWDPTKWLIRFLAWSGQASQLRAVSKEAILRARLKMDQKKVVQLLEQKAIRHQLSIEHVESRRLKIEHAYSQIRALKLEYKKVKTERMAYWSNQFHEKREELRMKTAHARAELKNALDEWAKICRQFKVSPTRLVHIPNS